MPLDKNNCLVWIRQYLKLGLSLLTLLQAQIQPDLMNKSLGLLHNHMHLQVYIWMTLLGNPNLKMMFYMPGILNSVSVLCRTKWWKWCKCRCFGEYYMNSCSFTIWAVGILHLNFLGKKRIILSYSHAVIILPTVKFGIYTCIEPHMSYLREVTEGLTPNTLQVNLPVI